MSSCTIWLLVFCITNLVTLQLVKYLLVKWILLDRELRALQKDRNYPPPFLRTLIKSQTLPKISNANTTVVANSFPSPSVGRNSPYLTPCPHHGLGLEQISSFRASPPSLVARSRPPEIWAKHGYAVSAYRPQSAF